MPEIPDLEVVKEVLERRVVGQRIDRVDVLRPIVLRVLEPGVTAQAFLEGRDLRAVSRRGKFLLFALDDGGWMVFNFMLAGQLRHCRQGERARARDYLLLSLSNGMDLRYNDRRGMGKVYLVRDLDLVPGFSEMGPDALDPLLTPEAFVERLRPYRGEIKGVLTRGRCVAGIGNAYADEILFCARIYPFRKSSSLSEDEQIALYRGMRETLTEAIGVVRGKMGNKMHLKVRDSLLVHNRKGEPCPRCGGPISQVKIAKRATNFCRRCQPGTLVRG